MLSTPGDVTACHYPSGASNWNPIEHRLFSEISKPWAAVPVENYPLILQLIGATTATTGLTVDSLSSPRTTILESKFPITKSSSFR